MPELPEVETVKRIIGSQVQGKKITGVEIINNKVIAHPVEEEFLKEVNNSRIIGLQRRGKYLCFHLENKNKLVLHLRMTGCLLLMPYTYPREKHTHVIFTMEDGQELRYIDTRRFGRFWLLKEDEDDIFTGISKLGPEPFDEAFTSSYLYEKLGKRKKSIKDCLLDQTLVTGIGNIYASEILFNAGIRPDRPCNNLSIKDYENLTEMIPETLNYFIEKNAISPEDYLAGKGMGYRNTPFLKVYGHHNEPCPKCGSILCKVVVGGRSSVYCPQCQK